MKKLLALVLAGAMMLCAGCSQGEASGSGSAADDSWTKIEQAGKIKLGMDDAFPPMGYTDPQTGDIIGFDVDVAKEVFKRLNVELELCPIEWTQKETELNNGAVDMLWNGYSSTPERAEKVNLSVPYMKNNQIILVKEDSSYQSFADLAGKSVGVQADSSAEDALDSDEAKEFKDSLKEIVAIGDYSKAILEIKDGMIDAIAIDEVVARFYINNEPGAYRILMKDSDNVESLAVEDYVIGFRKGDDALKSKVEETLKAMAKDGKLAEIAKEWFGEDVTTISKD